MTWFVSCERLNNSSKKRMDENFQLNCFLNYGPTKKILALASHFPSHLDVRVEATATPRHAFFLGRCHGNLELTHTVGRQSSTKAQLDSSCRYSRPGAL